MTTFYIKEHTIYADRCKKDIHIVHISDLHACTLIDDLFLKSIAQKISYLNPDYICFTGDLLDDGMLSEDISTCMKLKEWLQFLAMIAPVILIRGNHDSLSFQNRIIEYYNSDTFFNSLNDIANVHVLVNNKLSLNNHITFVGVDACCNTKNYYEGKERKNDFSSYITPIIDTIKTSLDDDALNVLMFHSPIHLYDNKHEEYTLLLSGHMHDGIVPNIVDKFVPTNRGILSPNKILFPKYARGIKTLGKDTTGVIASPLVMSTKYLKKPFVRRLYRPSIECITLKNKD